MSCRLARATGIAALALIVGAGSTSCGKPGPDPGAQPPAAASATSDAAAARPVVLDTYDFGGDFGPTNQDGRPFDLAQGRGRVHLLFFGYTMCPDVCPMTLSRIARAFSLLTPEQRAGVVTLFATVDVDRDTPVVLAHHLQGFPVPVVGLTGTRAQVDAVVAQYRASYEIKPSDSAAGPSVSHSTYLYLIDREGRLRHFFRLADTPEQIAEGIRLALAAPGAQPAGR